MKKVGFFIICIIFILFLGIFIDIIRVAGCSEPYFTVSSNCEYTESGGSTFTKRGIGCKYIENSLDSENIIGIMSYVFGIKSCDISSLQESHCMNEQNGKESEIIDEFEEDNNWIDYTAQDAIIFGGNGNHKINMDIGEKNIYINDEYGITLGFGKEFDGGVIQERDTEEGDVINENPYNLHRIEIYKKDGGGEGYMQVSIINAVDNEQFEKRKGLPLYNENLKNDVLGSNNKYSFWSTNLHNNGVVDITNEKLERNIYDVEI